MVIVQLAGGLGNQFAQYVSARLLAYKLGTELKLDITSAPISNEEKPRFHIHYRLGEFNIIENFATVEEIKHVKENGLINKGKLPPLEGLQGDIYMQGQYPRSEESFIDIIDIVRKEFTLKRPFNPKAEAWRQKILSAECAVSMHFRHGDFAYNPKLTAACFNITPIDYYCTCIDILKQRYNNMTVFIFSDNLPWVKKNLHLDVPPEFVEGVETDNEEWLLMSYCKHNINPNSSFSECAASLNSNPDKKIFSPRASTASGVQQFLDSLTPAQKDSLLDAKGYIKVPFDYYNQPDITIRPFFSLLLVVNNDAATIANTLDSLLNQDYKYYEVIIIDNASSDGSDEICREKIAGKKNITYRRLHSKVKNADAWNVANSIWAEGEYVSFLKGNDRFTPDALTNLYFVSERRPDVIAPFAYLEQNENGNIIIGNEKFIKKQDRFFQKATKNVPSTNGQDAAKMLLNGQINSFLSLKIFYRHFLEENKIKFDKRLNDDKAELFFQVEAFFKAKFLWYSSSPLYIAPKN